MVSQDDVGDGLSLSLARWSRGLVAGEVVSQRVGQGLGPLALDLLTSLLAPLLLLIVGGSDNPERLLAALDLSAHRLPASVPCHMGGVRFLSQNDQDVSKTVVMKSGLGSKIRAEGVAVL